MDMNVDTKILVAIQLKCIVVWKVVIMTTEIIVHMMKLTGIIIDINSQNTFTHTHPIIYTNIFHINCAFNQALNVSSNFNIFLILIINVQNIKSIKN